MEIKSKAQQSPEKINENKDSKKLPSSDEFQKEIDKKLKEENKEKKQNTSKEERVEKNSEDKPKIDTKDLTSLKLFVLPYVNKDVLSVSIREYVDKDDLTKSNKQNKIFNNNDKLFETMQYHNLNNIKDDKKKKNNSLVVDFNPFATFEKLNNSLKEIAKEEKIKESRIIRELIEKLDVQKLQDSRKVEIKFDKENIGNLKVQILNNDNKINVVFKTSSKFLYDELKNNRELLKNMLESRNLKAERIVIDYEEVI
ncbi:MAG: flagellar hook-length control protein FliK [Candidatus Calescibacterium sp.]|nr:flagellar hook-length control protein FliK [Candidatus Calescibacterium sp.]MDW8132790.1 flagellar hook-length control protein FliK [Candidatus Calescibacterium sp.]